MTTTQELQGKPLAGEAHSLPLRVRHLAFTPLSSTALPSAPRFASRLICIGKLNQPRALPTPLVPTLVLRQPTFG
ncbi:hypothetical protein D9M68_209900 [compost metagenome]